MNTKGIKFLAVLAVLAMAFAACAVATDIYQNDAATGDGTASSPLADGAILSEVRLAVQDMGLELYLPQTMSAQQSVHAVTIFGTTTAFTAHKDKDWKGTYIGWNLPTISFEVKKLKETATGSYFIYQENPVLPETGNKKVSPLDLEQAVWTVADRGLKNNPSFEIPVPDASSADKTVVLKLIKADSAPSLDEAKKMADGENCVTYTFTFKAAPTEDAAAVNAGYSIVMSETVSSLTKKTYFKHFSGLLNSINDDSNDRTIAVKSLCDDVDVTFAQSSKAIAGASAPGERAYGSASNKILTATWDLGGFTYTSGAKDGSVVDNKSISLYDHMVWTITNGKMESESVASTQAQTNLDYQLIQSYGSLTLNKVTIDLSKVTWNTEDGKPAEDHYLAGMTAIAGTITIKDSKVFVSSGNFAAKAVWMVMSPSTYGTAPSKVIVDNSEIVGNLSAGTYKTNVGSGFTPAPTDYPELKIKSGSINGELSIMKDEPRAGFSQVINVTPVITIEGATIESGKTMTIGANTLATVSATADNVAGKILNNGTIVVKGTLNVKNNATGAVGTNGVTGTGKVVLENGAKLYGGYCTKTVGEVTTHPQLLNNVITAKKGSTVYYGEYDNSNVQIGTGGMINLTSGYAEISYNSSLDGNDYVIHGVATLADPTVAYATLATFLKANDTVTFGTDSTNKVTTITVSDNLTIPKDATLNVLEGASIVTDNDITVRGLVKLAESSQYTTKFVIPTTGDIGKVEIVGDDGSSEKEVKPVTPTGTTIDNSTFESGVDVIMTQKAGLTEVTVPTGKTVIIEAAPALNAEMDISADNTELTINTGNTAATYTVNAGGDNKIYLEGVKGSLTFTKGSIEIDISKWTGGEIKLDDDAVVKIFGTTSAGADLKISMKNSGKTATLSIEEDKTVDITFTGGYGLVIGAGIDFTIDGKLKATKLTTNDNVKVGSKGTLDATTYVADGTAKIVSVYGTLKVENAVTGAAKFVAYGTSDINDANLSYDKVTGKDSNGGTWEYASATKLVLKDYNGNYNFTKYKAGITSIVIEGTNKVSYAKAVTGTGTPAKFALFGNSTAMTIETVQGTGSLEVVLNLSKTTGANLGLAGGIVVFDSDAFTLNTADIKITVSGSKADWTAEQIRAMKITAVSASAVTIDDSSLVIDVMSSYSVIDPTTGDPVGKVYGIKSTDNITIANSDLSEISVKTAGEAINAAGKDLTVSGSAFILDAKDDALTVDDISFSNSSLSINGKNGIVSSAATLISFNGCILSEIKGGDYAIVKNDDGDPVDAEVKIRSSSILFEGAASVKALTITSGSIVAAKDIAIAGKLDISQASSLNVGDMLLNMQYDSTSPETIAATTSVNNGTITITGDGVIDDGAKLQNNATLINEGTFGVYGDLENKTPGVFTNNGSFAVFNKAKKAETSNFSIGGDVRTDDTKAKLKTVEVEDENKVANGDGSYSVKASLTFDMISSFTVKGADAFIGTFTPSQVADDGSYTLTLSNGTATVTISYVKDSSKTGTIGDNYTITVSGVLVDNDDATKVLYLEPNKSDKTLTPTDSFVTAFQASGAALVLESGKMVNEGTAVIYSSASDFIKEDATYEGDLTTKIAKVEIKGLFTGDLSAAGTTGVDVSNSFAGDIISNGPVSLTAADKIMLGDILATGNVSVAGTLDGNVKIMLKAGTSAKLTVSGKMLGELSYLSLYKAKNDDKIDTEYTNTINVAANMFQTDLTTKSFEVSLVAGVNATTSKDGEPGYFAFGTLAAPEAGKNVRLVLTEGMIKLASKVTLPERFSVVIEKDSTLEIVKGAVFDVKNAALKVNKDAIQHFETGTVATTYGLVEYVMSFAIEDGAYSIYSDVAYALTNCDEGAELTVGSSAKITDHISVKKGVNVIVSDKVTLEFQTFGLEMDEGAKITLMGTGKVTFGQTGEDKTDDTAWEFFTISGTFVFDEGKNKIVFDDVRFDAAGAELSGKAATASADSAFSVKLNYSEGEATLATGNATGSVVLKNTKYPLAKGADDSLFSGSFTIAADTVYEGTINDMAGDAEIVESIYTVTKKPTYVTIGGTFKATSGITVNGIYAGTGKVVLSDNKSITIAVGKFLDDEKTQYVAPSFTGIVVDTNVLGDEYKFALVSALPAGGADAGAQFVIKSVKDSSTQYIALNGTIYFGAVIVDDTAVLDTVTVMKNASITAETVEVLKNSGVDGIVAAKELKEKSEEYPKLGKLAYDATYEALGYTVYTKFANIDPELVSDITLTSDLTLEGEELDLSGYDINITIADGCVLKLKTKTVGATDTGSKLIIGTPATSLGEGGSSITGVVVIDGALSYIVAYADVDLDDAEIYSDYVKNDASKCKAAVYSVLDIDDVAYAALFANENTTVKLADADKKIIPAIEGYNFTKWCNYDEDVTSVIGETNAYADFKAVLVTIIVKYVAGVDYYMNGLLFQVFDTPTDVLYGSYFTAKISDTTKYQGNPMINGVKTYTVEGADTLIATGVEPIPVPPEPEPEPVVGDSGLSLTDILLIVLVILIAIMVVILVLRLNRS